MLKNYDQITYLYYLTRWVYFVILNNNKNNENKWYEMDVGKKITTLLILGAKKDPEFSAFKHFENVVEIKNKDGEVVLTGLKAPAFNPAVITDQGMIDIGDLRKMFGVDEDDPKYHLTSRYRNHFIRNAIDSSDYDETDFKAEVDVLLKKSLGISFEKLTSWIPEYTVTIGNDIEIPYGLAVDFAEIGDKQRGWAESTMLEYQRMAGTGVYPNALEHCGDLIHRCTHGMDNGRYVYTEMREKVSRLLNSFTVGYPFLQEAEDNLIVNHRCRTENGMPELPLQEYRSALEEIKSRYLEHHMALPSFNKLHLACKRATVALAKGDLDVAIISLKQIDQILESDYDNKAIACKIKDGKPVDITASDKYLSKFLDKDIKKELSYEM